MLDQPVLYTKSGDKRWSPYTEFGSDAEMQHVKSIQHWLKAVRICAACQNYPQPHCSRCRILTASYLRSSL